jgi:hypothetical protein
MRLDDLRYVFRLHASIPNSFRIDDYSWTVFTLVKTARFIGSYGFFQPTARNFLFEGQLQAAQPFRITASTRIAGWTLIGADKYMMFKFWHKFYCYSVPRFFAMRQAVRQTRQPLRFEMKY